MIRSLLTSNFKAFAARTDLDLAPITLIFGPNSAGKSSIIQALLLLKQTLASSSQVGTDIVAPRLMPRGELVDLGSYANLIHRHEVDRPLELGVKFDRVPVVPQALTLRNDDLRTATLGFEWDRKQQAVDQRVVTLGLGTLLLRFDVGERAVRSPVTAAYGRRFSLQEHCATDLAKWLVRSRAAEARHQPQSHDSPETEVEELRRLLVREGGETRRPFRGQGFFPRGGIVRGEDPLMRYRMRLDRLLRTVELELSTLLGELAYLGPLRAAPARFNEFTGQDYASVGTAGEFTPELLARNSNLLPEVNTWFKRLGIPYELGVETIAESEVRLGIGDLIAMTLTERRGGLNVTPRDVGFGISQLLPIVAQLLLSQHRVICVEQPEIHVHPKLQASLGDLFIAAVERPANQVIVETHSEHLMLRILRRIREGRLAADAVTVLYLEKNTRGRAVIHCLRLDEFGDFIDEWPGGFFPERLEELA